MKRAFRWLAIVLAVIVSLGIVTASVVYVWSENVINRTYDVGLLPVVIPGDSLSVAEGRRLATVRGCYNGCHGEGVDGGVFFDEPGVARLVAPNLTVMMAEYSDEELARLIRFGVKRDGKSSMAMPTEMLFHLSDEDLGSIIAFLRSLPRTDGPATEMRVGPMGRIGVVAKMFPPSAVRVPPLTERFHVVDPNDMNARGRYLALTACSECHGGDLMGYPNEGVPGLGVVAAYSDDAFTTLMREGVPLGDRELGLMAAVSRSRFAFLTEEEIAALHSYLRTFALEEVRQ